MSMSPEQPHPFMADFQRMFQQDKPMIKPWMVSWAYQDQRIRMGKSYEENLPTDFYSFSGEEELGKWVEWLFQYANPDYFRDEEADRLVALSAEVDLPLFERNGIAVEVGKYHEMLGRNNMQDYRLANMYPVPERYEPQTILDFGAGFGRQANLWTQLHPDIRLISMDAIPKSYCLQRFYYQELDFPLFEYAGDPTGFSIGEEAGIYHLPTWRFDLIPDHSLDLVLCIQVLPELSNKLARYVLGQFHRILKPGGALMIRDGGGFLRLGRKFARKKYLEKLGFVLEFRPYIQHKADMHGLTRIWRKADPKIEVASRVSLKDRFRSGLVYLDASSGGRLSSLVKKHS